MSGAGAWKSFVISDVKTGEVINEVKFYKADFDEKVRNVPEFKPYMEALYDAAFIMKHDDKSHHTYAGIDLSAADEVEAAKQEVSPENQ